MASTPQPTTETRTKERLRPTASAVLDDGTLVEMLYRPEEGRTLFCVSGDEGVRYARSLEVKGERLVPYSPHNNLLRNEVVLFPSEPEDYGTEEELVTEIRAFLHRYVDVSALFEQIAAYYVLLSWVYDAFQELPYLRVQGDYGSGKTRFLLIVGSLCYRPIFASGASTVSPIFRILDAMRGTLVVDEGDFRFSDEKAEVVKILNNGNARGFPVLRSELKGKEYNPTAYHVFGPKLVATRRAFEDPALESRCLTEEMGTRALREDVPISLPPEYKAEALALRNRLLWFRLTTWHRRRAEEGLVDRTLEPRLNQIFVPLLSVIEDERAREDLRVLAREVNRQAIEERGIRVEAQVLEVIRDMGARGARLAVKEIASWFADRHGEDYERVTPRWIGSILRKRLQLKTRRGTGGGFVVAESERPKLGLLFQKYGIEAVAGGPEPEESRPTE